MRITDAVKLRDEVIRGEIHGWDSVRGIFEHGKEEDPGYIFDTTYPTAEIKNIFDAIDKKLKGVKNTGFFEIMGGYGTGKSRILCLLWHLFKNTAQGRIWLKNNNIDLDLPTDVTVLVFSLMDEPPNYLWEPIFKGFGREDLLKKVTTFPGTKLLKDALSGNHVSVILIDEVESWYKGVKDKHNNLNFMQVLAEVACEETSKLLVFCTLYGEIREILSRLDRVKPYHWNLTLSKDRHKIVLFRLLADVNKRVTSEIVRAYMKHYHNSEVEMLNPPSYEHHMAEVYPIHPELMDVLLTRYSSSPNYQNTRGVLCLLASVLAKKHQDVDLLLASDVDMSEEDLLSLDRVLTENAQKDAQTIRNDLTRRLLNTILLYSFGEGKNVGASRNDVILGVLRPEINVNDVDVSLSELPNVASHVWIRDSKYVIGYEANIITLIQSKALENIEGGKIQDALEIIKARLKRDLSYLVHHPNPELSDEMEGIDRIRVAVSLKALNQSEINEFYKGKKFANRFILYIPKSGDLTRNEDILVIAERLRLCDHFESEVSGENKTLLNKLRNRDGKFLKEKLSESYGYWVKITDFKDGEVEYRLIPCDINEVKAQVIRSYDAETIRDEIRKHLEGKESGLRLDDITYDFKVTPGKPIIIRDAPFEDALRSLYRQGEIIFEYKGKYVSKPDTFPPLKSDMKAILSKYAPPPQKVMEEEIEEKVRKVTGKPSIAEFVKPPEVEVKIEEKEKPVLQTIETTENSSPFALSYEIERKLPGDVQIRSVRLIFSGASFKDFQSFIRFINSLNIKMPKILDAGVTLVIEGPMDKKEVIGLIDKLPPSLGGGNVKAVIEAEKVA